MIVFTRSLVMNEQEIIKKVVEIIRDNLSSDDYRILLFGSHARGDNYPTSDIDIAILGEKPVPQEKMDMILACVGAIRTLRKIDVVDLCSSGEEFKKEVLSYARSI